MQFMWLLLLVYISFTRDPHNDNEFLELFLDVNLNVVQIDSELDNGRKC